MNLNPILKRNKVLFKYIIFNIYIQGNIKDIEEKINEKVQFILENICIKYGNVFPNSFGVDIRINYSKLKEINEEKLDKITDYEIYKYDSEHDCKYNEECCLLEQNITDIDAWIEKKYDDKIFREKYITIATITPDEPEILGEINIYIEEIKKKNLNTALIEVKELLNKKKYSNLSYYFIKKI